MSKGGRNWDLFAMNIALNEREPVCEDLEMWAQWYERKAAAAALLRKHGSDIGDQELAEVGAVLEQKATWAAAELRRHRR